MVNIERIIKWVITIKSRITFNLGIFVCIKSRQQVILFLDVYFSFKLLLILNKSIQEFLENTKSKTIMTDNEIYAWLIYLPWTMRLLLCETWVKLVFLPLLKKKKKKRHILYVLSILRGWGIFMFDEKNILTEKIHTYNGFNLEATGSESVFDLIR